MSELRLQVRDDRAGIRVADSLPSPRALLRKMSDDASKSRAQARAHAATSKSAGFVHFDIRLTPGGELYVILGQSAAAGMDYDALIQAILEAA